MSFSTEHYYRTGELAALLPISKETICREIRRGRLKAIQFGPRKWRIAPEAVEEWLKDCGAPVESMPQGRPRKADELAREFLEFRASRAA